MSPPDLGALGTFAAPLVLDLPRFVDRKARATSDCISSRVGRGIADKHPPASAPERGPDRIRFYARVIP